MECWLVMDGGRDAYRTVAYTMLVSRAWVKMMTVDVHLFRWR